jgi:hypothetical protein
MECEGRSIPMPVRPGVVEEIWGEVEKQDIYGRLGLSRNPFPASGNPPASPSIPPYPEVREQIKAFVISFLRSKQSRGLVLLGDYGTGKTYHLRWIQTLLEAKPEVAVRVVSVETPGLEPYDLVREILAQIGDQELAKAVWKLASPVVREHIRNEGQRFFRQFAQGGVKPRRGPQIPLEAAGMEISLVDVTEETLRDYRQFLWAFDHSGVLSRERLRDWFLPLLSRSLKDGGLGITRNPAIARELANLCFLTGVPALESWERLVVGRKSSFPTQGEPEFLQTILRLLVAGGTEYFVLLLDEFEKIPLMENMTQREMRRYLDTVRMLADKGWQEERLPFAWVIASHDDAWDLVRNKLNQALAERFPTEVNLPRSTDTAVARYLVLQHLALVRPSHQTGEDLLPFPSNLIELIPPELRHTPRDLLTLCYDLIEEAVAGAEIKEGLIPAAFVSQFVQRYRLPGTAAGG